MYLPTHDGGTDAIDTCNSFDVNSPTFAGRSNASTLKGDFMFDMVANCAHDLKTVTKIIFSYHC